MFCRDPVLLAGPTRRVKLYRRLAISLPAVIVFLGLLVPVVPSVKHIGPLGGYAILFVFGCAAFATFGLGWSFRVGAIRCPCCGEPFSPRSRTIPRAECDNCGFNVETGHRKGDF
jgi:hypothetical protein